MIKKYVQLILILVAFTLGVNAQNWDVNLTKRINPRDPNSGYWKLTSGSAFFVSGAVPLSLLAAGIIENDGHLKKESYEIFGSIAIEILLSEAMKISINRQRPAQKYPLEIFPYRKNINGQSFPSGHTSLAFASAASLSIQYKKWYVTVPAYLWATSVAYSRVYLGVHYPSDVLAGAAVGIGSAYLSHWLGKKIFAVKKKNKQKSIE
jgi:membrane-associated phospholipid phosphatase